jgi:hypothetical protein
MDSGTITHRGPMRDLAADDALLDALLGLDLRKRAQAAKA